MSKESVIQSMKEDLDYRNAFGKYISSCEGYLLAMHALSAPSAAEEYAKWKLMDLGLLWQEKNYKMNLAMLSVYIVTRISFQSIILV